MQYSVKDLKGYAIGATDGDIGKVDDFYFDDEFWTIRYLVAETGNWLMNRKVLISPFALGKTDLSRVRFDVTLTKKQVEESPSMDTDEPVSVGCFFLLLTANRAVWQGHPKVPQPCLRHPFSAKGECS